MRRKKQKKILIYNTVKQAEQNKLYRQCIADQIKYLDENFDKRSKEMAEFAVFVEQVKGYLKDRELDEDFDNFIAEFQIIGYDHKKMMVRFKLFERQTVEALPDVFSIN